MEGRDQGDMVVGMRAGSFDCVSMRNHRSEEYAAESAVVKESSRRSIWKMTPISQRQNVQRVASTCSLLGSSASWFDNQGTSIRISCRIRRE